MPPAPKDTGSEAARKAMFAKLVEIQDSGVPVGTSRQKVAEAFHVAYELVVGVELEGLEKRWPP